ncbi:MAG: HEAT repeat domain-containing protein [Verrucomicrobiales bacterium]|nr:HEAT repeat domain-containing protein [Verrucomicrobiales bacterium]
MRTLPLITFASGLFFVSLSNGFSEDPFEAPPIKIADGFEISIAAAPPLVSYSMMACLDHKGRLYIAESDGRNLTTKAEIEKELPRFVRRLVDNDSDGVYDESTIFADNMTMPEGGLWHDGALYIISAPYLWRLEDTDDDGVADKREKILGYMEFDGRANQHGPYLGPNGRFYFSGGHFGYQFKGPDGSVTGQSRAAGVFSCNPDGTDVRIEGQGGINPVEIEFTDTGEMLSTCAIYDSYGGRHDALIHWIHGGLTQRVYGLPLLHDTGHRLPATSRWGQVAPAGLVRYRGKHFGDPYKDSLFACHFNTHKVVHVRLKKSGSTFITEEEDFISSSSIDFHPTDILEDADGSLLLLDTGGWLSWGCPFSKIAKPEIRGAIYRISKINGSITNNARGQDINWNNMKPLKAAELINDEREAVRQKASVSLVKYGDEAIPSIEKIFNETDSIQHQTQLLWTLSRIRSKGALSLIRKSLGSKSSTLKQVAARSVGILKDKESGPKLTALLHDEEPQIIRTAATSIGQIKEPTSINSLFKAISKKNADLHIQHAIIYALIEIGDSKGTAHYLKDNSQPHLQKISLRSLDKMPEGALKPEMVVPLLNSPNLMLKEEAQRVISGRPQWKDQVLTVFNGLITKKELTTNDKQIIESIILSFSEEESLHNTIHSVIADPKSSVQTKVQLLTSIGFMEKLPDGLLDTLKLSLRSTSVKIKGEAIAITARFNLEDSILRILRNIAANLKESVVLRVAAMEAIAKQSTSLKEEQFNYLAQIIQDQDSSPSLRSNAARALSRLEISVKNQVQALALCNLITKASPLQIKDLTQPFIQSAVNLNESGSNKAINKIGVRLAAALVKVQDSIHPNDLKLIADAFPESAKEAHSALTVLAKEDPLADRTKKEKLESVLARLKSGNGSRGRALFYSNRSTCSLCHRVAGQGGLLGPDLSKIGSIRKEQDLLEAIIFPSSTVVNGYENYIIQTHEGNTHLGIIQHESSDSIYVSNANGIKELVMRKKIKSVTRSPISLMPAGFEGLLTDQDLSDLIAFLGSCK